MCSRLFGPVSVWIAISLVLVRPALSSFETCLQTATESELATTLEARIEFYKKVMERVPAKASSGSRDLEGTYCLDSGCSTISRNWFLRFLKLGIRPKAVSSGPHTFLVDDRLGHGQEIIIDGTYLQLLKIPSDIKLDRFPKVFVGTIVDLEDFLRRNWAYLNENAMELARKPLTPESAVEYFYAHHETQRRTVAPWADPDGYPHPALKPYVR